MYAIKLAGAGLRVEVASTGPEAYNQIMALKPDFVLLDLNLPEQPGFEVVAALQASRGGIPISRIAVLTNSAHLADRQRAAALGMDYLIKAEMTPREVLNYVCAKLGLAVG
jgi:CheY-like chemotaxis protein